MEPSGQPAWAQAATSEGRLNAVVLQPMPKEKTVRVILMDDSQSNKAIRAHFEKALTDAGYTVTDAAALQLTFEADSSFDAGGAGRKPSAFELRAQTGSGSKDDYSARVNLFSTGPNGLTSPRPEPTSGNAEGSFQLEAILTRKADNARLWQGWAAIPAGGGMDADTLTRALIPELVRALGTPARNRTFPIVLP